MLVLEILIVYVLFLKKTTKHTYTHTHTQINSHNTEGKSLIVKLGPGTRF